MSERGREALKDVREWSVGRLEWSGGHPGCPGVVEKPYRVVGSPSRMSGSGQEALPNVREWLEALPDVWEWSGGPPGCPRVVGIPSRMSDSGR